MKTSEIIIISNLIAGIESKVEEDKLKPFKYAFLRNKLRFANRLKEASEITSFLIKESGLTEEKEINDYVNNSEKYKSFLEEEVEIELYTIKLDKLEEDKDFSLAVANVLLGIIIIE